MTNGEEGKELRRNGQALWRRKYPSRRFSAREIYPCESGGGPPHSKTWRKSFHTLTRRSVLDCASLLALFRLRQALFKLSAGCGHAVGIQNGGYNTNTRGAGGEDLIDVLQINTTDGKPGHFYVLRGPSNIFQGDRFGGRFCAGGIHRADGDVICPRVDSALGLFRCVSAQANAELRVES